MTGNVSTTLTPGSYPSTSFLLLQPRAREELIRRGIDWRQAAKSEEQFCPHEPTEKQQQFLALDCREAIYGGAAGGGKSDALLMAALQYVHVPGYHALLLRRTFADLALPESLMARAAEWLTPTSAKWHDLSKTWVFPSGATLTFGYLEIEKQKYRYQGPQFHFVGWDELTQFTETMYRYLFSRLRRMKTSSIPIRMRSASNPGGEGHEWVKQRFEIPDQRIEGMHVSSTGRVFVPARIADNPHLDEDEYNESLAELPAVERQQLMLGDWAVRPEGKLFHRSWFDVVEAKPADCRWVRYWDLAATREKAGKDPDWTAGVLVGKHREGFYFVADVQRVRETPHAVEKLIRQTAEIDGPGVEIRMEQEPGSSGVSVIDGYTRRVLEGFDFRGRKSTGEKAERAKPVSSQAEAGNIKLVRGPWISAFLDELTAFPTEGVHDDQVDALSGAMAELWSERVYTLRAL